MGREKYPMNIVVIAVDTLRADALSCYGNPQSTSPHIDRLASEGILFDNFYSVGNCTHPGFTSMISGMHPESTRVVSHWTRVAPREDLRMMAEYFAGAGFNTTAIDNLYDGWRPKHPYYPWFRKGYSHYEYPKTMDFYEPGSEVTKMACDWLDSEPVEPFLLFVHYWDTHAPYNKAPITFYRFYSGSNPCDPNLDCMPLEVRESQRRVFKKSITDPGYVVAAYNAEASYVDDCIGKVVSKLEKLGFRDETVVIVTSDHGDIMPPPRLALGRLWCFCHIGLNEDCIRIPLIVSGPEMEKGTKVMERFQLIDILPSLLDLAGIERRVDLDGRSFSPAVCGDHATGRKELFFSENTYQKQRAVLSWPWKYMRMEAQYNSMAPKCLYNLKEDPMETRNLSDVKEEVVDRMDLLIDKHIARTTGGGPDPLKVQEITSSI